jgi:1,4-alpha-glucan branching enzyme
LLSIIWDRQGSIDSVVGVANTANQNRDGYVIGFPRAGLWKTRFSKELPQLGPNFCNHSTTDVETDKEGNDGLPCSGEIGIGPYTVSIFSQDE